MRALALLLCSLIVLAPLARAEDAPDVKAIISGQLDAFSHDDAKAAYEFAAPQIREKFPDAETFMTMVKSGYPPVYRHRSVQFGDAERNGDDIRQNVVIVDEDNRVWRGVYLLEREADGAWKIQGCALLPSDETSL